MGLALILIGLFGPVIIIAIAGAGVINGLLLIGIWLLPIVLMIIGLYLCGVEDD